MVYSDQTMGKHRFEDRAEQKTGYQDNRGARLYQSQDTRADSVKGHVPAVVDECYE
jgi:hypothetical protein